MGLSCEMLSMRHSNVGVYLKCCICYKKMWFCICNLKHLCTISIEPGIKSISVQECLSVYKKECVMYRVYMCSICFLCESTIDHLKATVFDCSRSLEVTHGQLYPALYLIHLRVYVSVPNSSTCCIFMSPLAFLIRHVTLIS